MAHVYLALDTRLRRYTALKVIAPSLRTDESYEQRFEREAQAIAQLEHPNIVRVYRFGVAQDLYYMAMQYIGGADVAWLIKDYRKRNVPMGLSDVQAVATEIGAALDYAHEQKVIHRDVKPGNILIDKDGHAILTDFGLALHADYGTHGDIFGSPHYMSPEQVVSSANAIPQSDFYAFGVTLFEMLTGALPFGEGSPMDIAMRHVSDQPPPPSQFNPELTEAIDAVILRTLEKEPEKRFQTGAELSTALKNAIKQGRSGQTSVLNKRASRRTIPERVRVYVEESALPIESKIAPSEPAPPPPPPPAPPAILPANFGDDLPLGESALLDSWSVPSKPAPAVSLGGEDKKKADQPAPKKNDVAKPGSASPIPTIPLAIGLGIVGVILLLFVASRLIGGSNTASTPTSVAQVVATSPATEAATDAPTPTLTPTASATPFPTPNTTTLGLRFRSGSWVALVNTGRWPLDLANVQLKREADVLPVAKGWGRTALQPGECLRIYRGEKPPTEKPNDCKTVIDFIGETPDRAYWSAQSVRIWWSKSYSQPLPQ
jgi:serine/threonine protein kinase